MLGLLKGGLAEGALQVVGDATSACEHLLVVGWIAFEDGALLIVWVDGLTVHARLLHYLNKIL